MKLKLFFLLALILPSLHGANTVQITAGPPGQSVTKQVQANLPYQTYAIIKLNPNGDYTPRVVVKVTNSGYALVWSVNETTPFLRRWYQGALTPLIDSGTYSSEWGGGDINNSGLVVGASFTGPAYWPVASTTSVPLPFLNWRESIPSHDLYIPAVGWSDSNGNSGPSMCAGLVNDAGVIIGGGLPLAAPKAGVYSGNRTGIKDGFKWSAPDSIMTRMGDYYYEYIPTPYSCRPIGTAYSYIWAYNNDGVYIGLRSIYSAAGPKTEYCISTQAAPLDFSIEAISGGSSPRATGQSYWWQAGQKHDLLGTGMKRGIDINNSYDILGADGYEASATAYMFRLKKLPNLALADQTQYEKTGLKFPSNWSQLSVASINDNGVIAGSGTYQELSAAGTPSGASHPTQPLLLVPAELAVDANRDGVITLASDFADPTLSDQTSKAKPFRFWSNDDIDVTDPDPNGAADVDPSTGVPNYNDAEINGIRDLEDFTRLKLYVGGMQEALISGQIKVGLKWKNPDSTTPSIKVWRNLSPNGGREYLTDVNVAEQHVSLRDPGLVENAATYIIPTRFWTDVGLSASQPYGNLLFEGCTSGKGQLVMVLTKSDGAEIGEGPGVWIELKGIKELYEHWTCGDTAARDAVISGTATHPTDSSFEYSLNKDGLSFPGAATYNDYVLFVHGWRMMPWERRTFAETAFKRLYHQGYKGKFGFFSWPTEWIDFDTNGVKYGNAAIDPQHYDRCEVQARRSGKGPLHELLTRLQQRFGESHVNVFAHSMGNVVVSEALWEHPANSKLINSYIACQSAEVAHTYDQSATPNSTTTATPDRYRYNPPEPYLVDSAYLSQGNNYYKGVSSRANTKFVNFANLGDNALSSWDINQSMKPDDGWWPLDTAYESRPEIVTVAPLTGRTVYTEDPPGITEANKKREIFWPNNAFVILAHIIQARSRATGATVNLGGEFSSQVDLGAAPHSFGSGPYSHSAEFLSNFAQRRAFYFHLLTTFRLSPDPLDAP